MMPFKEFTTTLERDLAAAGLGQFIVRESSQFLDFRSDFFVDLVLNDGSKLLEAEGLLAEAAKDLQKVGASLRSVVRADWEVKDIKPIIHAISSNGYPKACKAFMVVLKSGNATCTVSVQVTPSAIGFLRRKHADTSRSTDGSIRADELAAVQQYLEHQLSYGGTSYWNPLKYGRLELNERAMLYLFVFGGLNRGSITAFPHTHQQAARLMLDI
jgi:hypothetical protein